MSFWGLLHIVFILLSLAVFLVSLASGVAYLVQESRIKGKGKWMERLPSLEKLDRIHFKALYVGFVFFTAGIISGGGWSKTIHGVYVTNDPRQLATIALWVFYALLLNLRVPQGWIGRKGILLTTFGFIAMVFLLVQFL
ncbi:MAG: cytochrome c biogenesis protein CcsA [Deltaproteobacteria bacterium]|nr:cytochrome c biogenesis protein CcsA [Deltaproteobacteria bacterium]